MFSLVGRKVGMSQMFSEGGDLIAVTAIEVEPNLVVDVRTQEKNGYSSLVVGYGKVRESLLSKPVKGQYSSKNLEIRRDLYELKGVNVEEFKVGDLFGIGRFFKVGDLIDVRGVTRGHGFTGAIKLWNFSCGPRTHGAGYPHRFTGSLETGRGGASGQKVWKGKKMSGRYGNENVSVLNLEIVYIDEENNLLFVRGAVPGRKQSIVKLKPTNRKNKSVAEPFKAVKYEKN